MLEIANLALQYVALFFVNASFSFNFPWTFVTLRIIFLTTDQLTHTPNVPHCSNGLRAAASWFSCYRTISMNFFTKWIKSRFTPSFIRKLGNHSLGSPLLFNSQVFNQTMIFCSYFCHFIKTVKKKL